jgi:hypothetical protein
MKREHRDDLSVLSRAHWEPYRQMMVDGLYNSVAHHPVELLVFSGGLICRQDWMVRLIENELVDLLEGVPHQYGLRGIAKAPKRRISAFGESAGTLGALALGRRLLGVNNAQVSS